MGTDNNLYGYCEFTGDYSKKFSPAQESLSKQVITQGELIHQVMEVTKSSIVVQKLAGESYIKVDNLPLLITLALQNC